MAGSASPSSGGGGGTKNPSVRSAASQQMQIRSQMMRSVYGGTELMRLREKDFLPQYDKESNKRYEARLQSTFALNKLREAVDAASAKPFKTVLTLSNSDPDLDLLLKNCDLMGNHMHIFGHTWFNDAMLIGQSHILVDHPTTMNLPNLGAQKAAGVRPFFKMIKDDNLLAAYQENNGGVIRVNHARIADYRVGRADDFSEIIINQIYVLEIEPGAEVGVVQLWEQPAASSGGEWTLMSETPLTVPEVPLVTLNAGEKEANFVTRPVFLDLAYKQIEHWISSSDQRSILSAGRFPMLAASGVELDPDDDEEGFAIGPYKVLYSPDAAGRWYYVEPKGTAIESGFKDLEMLEMQMNMMALNPTTATGNQYVAKDERDVQETRTHSVVHDLALACRDGLKKAVQFAGAWTGKDYSNVLVNMNADFTNTADKMAQITLLLSAYEKRGISRETFLSESRNLDFLSDDFDPVAELARMAAVDAVEKGASPEANITPTSSNIVRPPAVDFPGGGTRPKPQI
ncbi:DUF4055 domain-containing protein [Methylobacterium sp. WL120]|uniref:DUF4055 domain-containing protein n=1 Tax=Methylobacterium sp. WL120 TaxID=2603887 RepID=UPI0011CAC832|nr:DUF4055 domain-containing protein [Methylobacterium sp. WL120]TXM68187.1 DUF4055 domain-containing protein [Methylobacterium sp. WL120]